MAAQQHTIAPESNESDIIASQIDTTHSEVVEEPVTSKVAKKQSREVISDDYHEDKSTKALDATQLYLNEIGFSPLLNAEEEVYYARKALKGEEAARKRMIESNLRLVVKISRRRLGGFVKPSSAPL